MEDSSIRYSFGKFLDYVAHLAKEPVHLEIDGTDYNWEAPDRIVLSPLFFRGDDCFRTGKCCKNYDIVFTQEGVDEIHKATKENYDAWGLPMDGHDGLLSRLTEKNVLVNGSPSKLWMDPATKESKATGKCNHLQYGEDGLSFCDIQPVKSITCHMPHNVVKFSRGTTHIRKQQFGRNWALGCPVKFRGFDYERFTTVDVPLFERLGVVGDDLGIETWIPEILDLFKSHDEDLKNSRLPKSEITFLPEFKDAEWIVPEDQEHEYRMLSITLV